VARAHAQGGEDPNVGLCLLSSLGQGSGSPCLPQGGQTEVIAAKLLSASPQLTTDGADKMYHQLAEIHAIAAVQLAECTHRRQSDPTTSLVHVGAGQ
jgi:hypothetical protein